MVDWSLERWGYALFSGHHLDGDLVEINFQPGKGKLVLGELQGLAWALNEAKPLA